MFSFWYTVPGDDAVYDADIFASTYDEAVNKLFQRGDIKKYGLK